MRLVVGAVNFDVTARALTCLLKAEPGMRYIDGLWFNVAFQAQLPLLPPYQQVLVDGSMRRMAGGASFHPNCGMFIHKWSPFFDVAGIAAVGACRFQSAADSTYPSDYGNRSI